MHGRTLQVFRRRACVYHFLGCRTYIIQRRLRWIAVRISVEFHRNSLAAPPVRGSPTDSRPPERPRFRRAAWHTGRTHGSFSASGRLHAQGPRPAESLRRRQHPRPHAHHERDRRARTGHDRPRGRSPTGSRTGNDAHRVCGARPGCVAGPTGDHRQALSTRVENPSRSDDAAHRKSRLCAKKGMDRLELRGPAQPSRPALTSSHHDAYALMHEDHAISR